MGSGKRSGPGGRDAPVDRSGCVRLAKFTSGECRSKHHQECEAFFVHVRPMSHAATPNTVFVCDCECHQVKAPRFAPGIPWTD